MALVQLEFNGSPYLGVFARANDKLVLVPPAIPDAIAEELARALDVTVRKLTLGGSNILGAVIAMNNNGAVVADFASDDELKPLTDEGLNVARVAGKFNAAGNNVLANDAGALVNPDLGTRAVKAIEDALGVPVRKGTLAQIKTVGSAAAVNGKGALCHPKTTEEEIAVLEELLGVEADIGTINHGAPYIGAGIVANTKGAAIGVATTGPEISRIEDALQYY